MRPKVILLHESLRDGVISDLVTFLTLVIPIAIGIWFESQALQWIGGEMFVFISFWRAAASPARRVYSIRSCREYLDFLENSR